MLSLFRKRQPAPAPAPELEDEVVRISLRALIALHRAANGLQLRPARIRALQSGSYLSTFKGRGMEFDESRPYMPGDDVRSLDWRVMARSGKAHTKIFREERERTVLLWGDLRQNMFFATQGAYKSVRLAQSVALLAWSALQHGDRVGALFFTEQTHLELRPQSGKQAVLHLFKRLVELPAWQGQQQRQAASTLAPALLRLRRVAQPGSLVFLLSDFADLDEPAQAHLAQLARHCDVVLIAMHDPLDVELPSPGRYRVSDGQRFISILSDDRELRQRYHQRYEQQQTQLQQLCRRHGIYWIPMSTAEQPLDVLQRYLAGKR